MEIIVVFTEPSQVDSIKEMEFTFLDENSKKTRRKAFQMKGAVGARLTPLVIIKDGEGKYLKAFYREEFKDPISEFLNWYNNDSNRS